MRSYDLAENDLNNTWQVHISTNLNKSQHISLTKDGQKWLTTALNGDFGGFRDLPTSKMEMKTLFWAEKADRGKK